VLRDLDAAAAEREIRVKGVVIMVTRIIVASALALFSIGCAGEVASPRSYAGAFRRRPSLRGARAPHGGLD
jgi:hypothetical protein